MRSICAALVSIFVTSTALVVGTGELWAQDSNKNLYMVQKPFESNGDIQLGYGYGFLNPYENLHHATVKANYRFHPNFQFGVQYSYIKPIKNDATKVLEASLGGVNIKTEFQSPEYAVHGTFGLIPLSGLLNFFSQEVIPFDFVIGVKAGITKYKLSGTSPSVGPYLEYKMYLFNRFGIYTGLEYTADRLSGVNGSGDVWVSQSMVSIGATWAF